MRLQPIIAAILVIAAALTAVGQTTEFTYQGQLQSSARPANGSFDFEFALFDAGGGGAQIGSTLTRSSVAVANGIFSVSLDFGSGFPGASRFLEIRVRQTGGGGFTTLSPRQPVTSSPYAIKSTQSDSATVATNAITANNATTANNALQLGGVAANQFVVTTDPRMTNDRPPTPGSSNYIQNRQSVQLGANFFIGGTGTASILNAQTQFNLGGDRILSTGTNNLFVGNLAGGLNPSGINNTFVGWSAGQTTLTGHANSFFGSSAGSANTAGDGNAFFGAFTGDSNTTGRANSFFGSFSGYETVTGSNNSYFGYSAGGGNASGSNNSYFGRNAGWTGDVHSSGSENSFFGSSAGASTTTGSENTFVGRLAGSNNETGSSNTIVGSRANVSFAGNLSFATAIGADALVSTSNTVVLGRDLDIVRVPGFIRVVQLGSAGSESICRNVNDTISTCSSSLRYKTNINRFGLGLDLVNQLKPITFDWKDSGMHDLGLGAEDVAAIEPLLVTYNTKGEVEGVKYDRIGVVLVNAVKEQQKQIDELKAIVCELRPTAAVCRK